MDRRWMVLAAIFIARTSMGYQFQSIGSVGALLIAELAIDLAVLGSLIGAYKLPGLILALPSGILGRRFGEKSIMVAGMALMALGGAISAASGSVDWIYVGRIVSGVGAVLFNVLSSKMVADWFAERELTVAMSIHVNSWPFGIAMGLATQAALADTWSLETMLFVPTMFSAIGVVLLVVGTRNRSAPIAAQPFSFRFGLSQREFVRVSLSAMIWVLFNANLIVVVSFAPAYLVSLGHDPVLAGQLSSIGTWLGVIAIPLGGFIAQRWVSGDIFMTATFIGGAAATLSITFLDQPVIAFIAFGLIAWAPAGAIMALPVRVLSKGNRAVGMGVFFSYYYLGIGVLPAVGGYLGDLSGDPVTPLVFAASLLLLAMSCLAVLRFLERLQATAGPDCEDASGNR